MTRYYSSPLDEEGWTTWVGPSDPDKHRIGCCDCGLIHDFQFRINDGRVQYRAKRNERATAAKRRHRKVSGRA